MPTRTDMPAFRQLDDAKYSRLRKDLLREKGSPTQRKFIERLRDSKRFCEWFREKIPSTSGKDIEPHPEALTEHEYKDPPDDTERKLVEPWGELTPAIACRPPFWGEITLRHIEAGRIESSYLAANGGSLSGGDARISRALSTGNPADIDGCVRTALRRFSGLPEARGNRSVYVNCPFGRAWWRRRLCAAVSENTPVTAQHVLNVFRSSQQYWENLITLVVSRNSVLGERNVRDTLVWSLVDKHDANAKSGIFLAGNLAMLCRLLGVRAAWQEFGVLEMEELKGLIDAEIRSRW